MKVSITHSRLLMNGEPMVWLNETLYTLDQTKRLLAQNYQEPITAHTVNVTSRLDACDVLVIVAMETGAGDIIGCLKELPDEFSDSLKK